VNGKPTGNSEAAAIPDSGRTHRVVAHDVNGWLVCSCGRRFNSVWQWAAHRNEQP
jgi:hypothetical protein